jgi:glycosyltransferase involved in cell wall biosynthesis
MKVSVIIPAYNEQKYIFKAISSLSCQSYDNYEVIIVDNYSTDNTKLRLISFFTNQSKFYYNPLSDIYYCKVRNIDFKLVTEKKQGTSAARECGRKISSGDIIAFLDADCIVNYNWIRNGFSSLKKENAVAVTGAMNFYDDTNFIRRNVSLFIQQFLYKYISYTLQFFKIGGIILGGNVFVLKEYLFPLNEDLTFYGDDTDMALNLIKYGKIYFDTNLTIKTSARRFKKQGFGKTNLKYIQVFLKSIFKKQIETKEIIHPR